MGLSRREFCSLAIVTVAVAACGGGDDDTEAATPDTDPQAPGGSAAPGTAAAPGTSAAPSAGELDPNAVLRYVWVPPTNLDPHKSSIAADLYILTVCYDRLIHQTKDVELAPGLAESWAFSDDGSSLELTLREGVVFHDGTPFDAEAVKVNLERGQTLEGSSVAGDLAVVTGIEVVDPRTVRLALSGAAASLPTILSAQAGMMISPAAISGGVDLSANPVGAGMYKAVAYEPGVKLTLERAENYWDPEAQLLGGVEIAYISDFTARLNALRDGQLDAARIAPAQAEEARGAGLNVVLQDSIEIGMLSLNRAKAPLDNVLVRQALNHAIDRQGIVDGLFFGMGTPSVQVYAPGLPGHVDDLPADTYAYDPDRARELLAEAGVADGFDMEINVAAIDFVISYAEAIQAQLGEIGVNATINQVALADYGNVVYVEANGEGTAVIGAARADASQTALQFTPGAFTNPGGASSPEVEELYNRSLDSTLSQDERNAVLTDLGRTLVDQAFSVVVFHPQNPQACNSRVVGYDNWRNVVELRGVGMKKA